MPTDQPRAPRSRAVARPMPRLAPVIRTTFVMKASSKAHAENVAFGDMRFCAAPLHSTSHGFAVVGPLVAGGRLIALQLVDQRNRVRIDLQDIQVSLSHEAFLYRMLQHRDQ